VVFKDQQFHLSLK